MFLQPELIDESLSFQKEVLCYCEGHYLIDETNLISVQYSKKKYDKNHTHVSASKKKLRCASTENKNLNTSFGDFRIVAIEYLQHFPHRMIRRAIDMTFHLPEKQYVWPFDP